jgi:hypothetical protein
VKYVTTCERIHTPAAVLTTLIQTDQDRRPAGWREDKGNSRERGRNNNGQSSSKSRERSHDFGLSKYTYPTNTGIIRTQENETYLDHTNVYRYGGIKGDSATDDCVRESVTAETLSNSSTTLGGYQTGISKEQEACRRLADGEIWEMVQEDLAGRYRLEEFALKLLAGSRLEVEGQNIRVVLNSIWQERGLGLAARSAIGLALRQRLGVSYELFFTVS